MRQWLAPDERTWLTGDWTWSSVSVGRLRDYSVRQSLVNQRVLGLSLVYFGAVATNYGLSFFLPQIVKAFGLNTLLTALVSATPYAVGPDRHGVVGPGALIASSSGDSMPHSLCLLRLPESPSPQRSITPR